jgi:hypothetical protein
MDTSTGGNILGIHTYIHTAPEVVDEWLTLLGIREVPVSNFDPQTGYPD